MGKYYNELATADKYIGVTLKDLKSEFRNDCIKPALFNGKFLVWVVSNKHSIKKILPVFKENKDDIPNDYHDCSVCKAYLSDALRPIAEDIFLLVGKKIFFVQIDDEKPQIFRVISVLNSIDYKKILALQGIQARSLTPIRYMDDKFPKIAWRAKILAKDGTSSEKVFPAFLGEIIPEKISGETSLIGGHLPITFNGKLYDVVYDYTHKWHFEMV